MGKVLFTYVDYGGEHSTVSVAVPDMTAANFTVQDGLQDALLAAIEAVSIGSLTKDERVATVVKNAVSFATNNFAQREMKWLVRCIESGTGNPVVFEIPCADLALLESNGERLDPASTEYADLKTAVEAVVRSNDGNTVTVSEVVFRGRNL